VAGYIAELVGFVLLLVFIYRWVAPPLKRLMDRRAATIAATLSSADAAVRSAEGELASAKEALARARDQASEIVERAHETAAQLRLEGERRGREEYQRIVANAAAEAGLERERARQEIAAEIGAIVVDTAEKVVAAEIDAPVQRAFIAEAIEAAEAIA